MANLKLYPNAPPDTWEGIEHDLILAEDKWRQLSQVEADIDSWDLMEQLDFTEEWPLAEERLIHLRKQAEAGRLDQQQLERWKKLKALVQQNRPIIERLLKS